MESSTSNSDEIGDEMKFNGVGKFDHDVISQNKERNPKIAREMLAAAVIKHDLPQSFVEYEGFRTLCKYLNPSFPCFSRNDIVSDINKLYLKEKVKLKQVLANTKRRVCLTLDVLSACPNECYICLAARFVDEDWKLNCKILNFDRVDYPDIEGSELAAKIGGFLTEWGIREKVFSLTTDNSSRNDTMRDVLKKNLLLCDNLLCGGEFFHGRCLGDILNLVVQDGLESCAELLVKIRESVKYVKGYESRRKRFADCVSKFSDIDSSVGLRLDLCTSGNLTYLMLDSAIKYKKAFASFRLVEPDYVQFCPTDEEWDRGEKLCEFLTPYYEIYDLICNSSSPTSNLYFAQVWVIDKLLKENLSSEDATISRLCGSTIEKLDKYWNENSTMLLFGAILDPRVKLQVLEHLYSVIEGDSNKCQEKISLVKSMLHKLFEDYSNASKSRSSQLQSSPKRHKSLFYEFLEIQRQKNAGKSQLDLYLEEPKLWYSSWDDLDVLEYWKNQRNRWPDLALMACDVLAFPITTTASESGFSIGAHLLTKYKSCTVPKNIQDMICTRSWLHGLVSNDDDDCLMTKTTLSDEGSNDDLESVDDVSNDRESVDDGCSRSKATLSDEGSDGWKSVDEET